jgi:hypothetical protein
VVPRHPFFNLDSRLLAASLYLDASDKHRLFSPVFYMACCSVWSVLVWANYREKFAIIGSSHCWHRTRFMMPQNVRSPVRGAEKLGLERVETISDYNEEGSIVYKFNADGHSFTLTSQDR